MATQSAPVGINPNGASPPAAPKVLVIDANADGRDLIARTLRRKFPGMILLESGSADGAAEMVRRHALSAIVAHRVLEFSTGPELVRYLRSIAPAVPIVLTSSNDYRIEALAAGATAFLPADEWLMIGQVIEEFVGVAQSHSARPFP